MSPVEWAVACFQPLAEIRKLAESSRKLEHFAFWRALHTNQYEAMEFLYSKVTPRIQSLINDSTAKAAIESNNIKIIDYLLEHQEITTYQNGFYNVLGWALVEEKIDLVQYLMQKNRSETDLNKKLDDALMLKACEDAASIGNVDILKLFIEINETPEARKAALCMATRADYLPSIQYIESLFLALEEKSTVFEQAFEHVNSLEIAKYFLSQVKISSRAVAKALNKQYLSEDLFSYLFELPEFQPAQEKLDSFLLTAMTYPKLNFFAYLCTKTSPPKAPDQASMDACLKKAVSEKKWEAVKYLLQASSANKPTKNCIESVVSEISKNLPESEQAFNQLIALTQENKPESLSWERAWNIVLRKQQWQYALALVKSLNKFDIAYYELKEIVQYNQMELFKTIYKLMPEQVGRNKIIDAQKLAVKTPGVSQQFKVWLANALHPESYNKLVAKEEEKLGKVRALLNDYTKGDSLIGRFFTGHWSRHHTQTIAQLVKEIDENPSISLKEVMDKLHAIRLVNQQGSLAKRVQYIMDRLNVDMEFESLPNQP